MKFLIEKTKFFYVYLDTKIVIKLIKQSKDHIYISMSYSELLNYSTFNDEKKLIEYIPIGTIEFVQFFYKKFYGIPRENSIEIPKELRNNYFLKRSYNILNWYNLPKKGAYFIKDATEQKTLTYLGEIDNFLNTYNDEQLKKHMFVCSEIINIKSECRFFVVRGEIKHISFYDGTFNKEIDFNLIEKAIEILNQKECFPKSYSLDVIISDRGTALLEIHTFLGLGVHNYMWDESLLYAYVDAHNYMVNYNFLIE